MVEAGSPYPGSTVKRDEHRRPGSGICPSLTFQWEGLGHTTPANCREVGPYSLVGVLGEKWALVENCQALLQSPPCHCWLMNPPSLHTHADPQAQGCSHSSMWSLIYLKGQDLQVTSSVSLRYRNGFSDTRRNTHMVAATTYNSCHSEKRCLPGPQQ